MSKDVKNEDELRKLLERYAEAAAAHGRASLDGDYKTANRKYNLLAEISSELRERGEEGRLALLDLLNHTDPHIRVWAAADALQFAPERAEATLVELVQSNRGLVSFTAEMTLEEWKKGRLTFPPQH